jgi:hypothetical protein
MKAWGMRLAKRVGIKKARPRECGALATIRQFFLLGDFLHLI